MDSISQSRNEMDRTFSVAPMMGCTDRHFRKLARLISPHTFLFTEMLVSGALIYGDGANFLQHDGDEPCALQIGGSNPSDLARCAVMAQDAGYQEINLNVGCPSDRVQYGRIGACLMAEPHLVADCLSQMRRQVDIPVTIKCRIGINQQDSYAHFQRFIHIQADAGTRVFYIHARSAMLDGLSPKQNREIPPLKYAYVSRIARAFPECTFHLNGGIKSAASALQLLRFYPGIMFGRAPYADPYLLAQLETQYYGVIAPSRHQVVTQYLDYAKVCMQRGDHPKHILKHLLGLFAGCPGARAFRRHLSQHIYEPNVSTDIVFDAMAVANLTEQARLAS